MHTTMFKRSKTGFGSLWFCYPGSVKGFRTSNRTDTISKKESSRARSAAQRPVLAHRSAHNKLIRSKHSEKSTSGGQFVERETLIMAKSSGQPRSVIKKEQWDMPVSFDDRGQPISLREYVQGGHNALSFSALSEDQRAELAAKRIEMQPDYEMASIGAGIVSKERAVDEVRTKTKLGRRLAQIETRVMMHLIDEATKRRGA
jgi:hypothetical protein